MTAPMRPMKDRPDLTLLIKEATERYSRMTPEEKKAMHEKQRDSWARQDMD